MNRIVAILFAAILSTVAVGTTHHETSLLRAAAADLRVQERSAAASLSTVQSAMPVVQQTLAAQKVQRGQLEKLTLDPQLVKWLLAGDYGRIDDGLLPKLSVALGLQWAEPTNYVLMAKSSLNKLSSCYSAGTNLLCDSDCGLLSISPEERQQIESACAATLEQFVDWARVNCQREKPGGNTLLRYTIPASPELAQSLTNNLYSAIKDAIGPGRAQLLWKYKDSWFGLQLGHFGSVANTLEILRDPVHPGKSDLWYNAEGHCGPIAGEACYSTAATFSNLFGGFPEILAREGIPIPKEPPNQPAPQ